MTLMARGVAAVPTLVAVVKESDVAYAAAASAVVIALRTV